jgi:hypothetical protein
MMAGTVKSHNRCYYAVWYAYGAEVLNTNGGQPNRLYRFTSKEARDAWVKAGPAYLTESGYREAVSSLDIRVARARRSKHFWQRRDEGDYWPFMDTEGR